MRKFVLGPCFLLLSAIAPAATPTLMLQGPPGQAVDGAFPNDTGGVFAITHVAGARRVVYQDGTSPAPNAIFQEGAAGTGAFETEWPLKPVHGTEYALVGAGGQTPASNLVILTPTGTVHYRLTPANYPNLVNPVLLHSWAVGVRIPAGGKGQAGGFHTRYICNAMFREGPPEERRTVWGIHFGKGPASTTSPLLFVPSRPETMENLAWRSYRNYATLQQPHDSPEGPGATFLDIGPGGYDGVTFSIDGFAVRPFGLHFVEVNGEPFSPQGTAMAPQLILDVPTQAQRAGDEATVEKVHQAAAAGDTMGLAVAGYADEYGTPGAFAGLVVFDAPQALAAAEQETEPALDCSRIDFNGDGKIDEADFNLMMDYALNQNPKGDLTGDGKVGSGDVALFHRMAEACKDWQGGSKQQNDTARILLATGDPVPGMTGFAVDEIMELRGNALGTNAMLISALPAGGGEPAKAVLLFDAGGFRTAIKTGDSFGQGTIVDIGDTTARRGLSPVNRHGQFTVTAQLADTSRAVYRFDGTNIDFRPFQESTIAIVNPLLGRTTATVAHDLNADGVVDAADVARSMQ